MAAGAGAAGHQGGQGDRREAEAEAEDLRGHGHERGQADHRVREGAGWLRTTVAVTVVGASRVEGLREAVQEVSREGVSRCQHVREAEAAMAVHGAQSARRSGAELQKWSGPCWCSPY